MCVETPGRACTIAPHYRLLVERGGSMRRTLVALSGMLLLAACSNSTPTGGASPTAGASPAGVSIKMTEFDFLMPDTIPAGVQTLHIDDVGGMPHFIEFQSIKAGK